MISLKVCHSLFAHLIISLVSHNLTIVVFGDTYGTISLIFI